MTTRVRINRQALNQSLRQPACQQALDETVRALQDKAEQLSPVGKGKRGGYFARRFSWRRYPRSRRLRNTDPFAHLVEFGSANNPIYAPLRRAARALGLPFKETPK